MGDAPWALSALPECFAPISKTTGPARYVLAQLPSGLVMARPGVTLYYADCRVRVGDGVAYVDRGTDHLRIPPVSRIYYAPGRLALLRGGAGGLDLRVYVTK